MAKKTKKKNEKLSGIEAAASFYNPPSRWEVIKWRVEDHFRILTKYVWVGVGFGLGNYIVGYILK